MFKRYLLPVFAVATLFPRSLSLPAPLQQVQLTEMLFPLLLWVFREEVIGQVRRHPRLALALGAYCLSNLLSASWAGHAGAMLEAGARGYLAVLVFVTLAHCAAYGSSGLLQAWKWGTVVVAGASLLAYGLIATGVMEDPLYVVSYFPQYPYFGSVYRLRGPADVYGMLYMLLLPGLLIAYTDWRRGRGAGWPLGVVFVAGLCTLAKEILLFPIGVLLLEAARGPSKFLTRSLRALAGGLTILLLAATHLLVVPTNSELLATAFTSGHTLAVLDAYAIVETNYTTNKRAALLVGARHPLVGVGPGRFAASTAGLVAEGRYPAHYGRFDPHSAWTGAFAETGLLGLLSLLVLVVVLFGYRPVPLSALAAILLLFLLASVFKDVMNFRGLWVVVGVYVYGRGMVKAMPV